MQQNQNYNMHYCEIKDVDLIAKEYKVHQNCYKNFTKGFSLKEKSQKKMNLEPQTSESESTAYSQSNYEEVKEYVKNMVIDNQCATSIKTLHAIYGLGIGKFIIFHIHSVLE